jgi:hypothetical protein
MCSRRTNQLKRREFLKREKMVIKNNRKDLLEQENNQ